MKRIIETKENNAIAHSFDQEITINRVACPIHVLQMKKGLKSVSSGETLKINSTAYVMPELLAAARQLSKKVISNDKNELFLVKK